ncbi:unnamed protein product [Ostreobium quekettii]|uniref:3-oxo-5-alpha-steroid 4-dehydrogenase C-terminal domain-containing protein n=1 Tax=Ostreobium quekettii TaxID=121088 RepID=A0A8S1JC85_9CHLO|nr:unnamed protein product [Ostreobium quekettii]
MFQAHLLRRLLESCFMLTSGRNDRMHTVAYVFGLSYYLVLPMTFVPDAWWMSFSRLNLPMDNVAEVPSYVSKYAEAAVIAVEQTQIVGFAIFLLGSVLQFLVHRQLSQLNPTAGAQAEGATPHVYKLPKGGLFEYVSCPHYFAEIIIYSGLLVTQAAKPALHLVMLWVVSNLALAAMETHRWYLKKFEDYPKHRKALIPFII